MQSQITITQFANTYYKEYSLYTVEQRAIPSFIDGLKVVQRKLLYSAIKYGKKEVKVAEISASIAGYDYHHAEASASDACILMAAAYNNNVPLFDYEGSFGTRLIPEASAPRYIFVTLSDNYKNIFMDDEVCPKSGEYEPIHYLPILPFVLLNGVSGISVGFACNILPHCPEDIKKASVEYLKTGKVKTVPKLQYPYYKGDVTFDGKRYVFKGIINEITIKRKKAYNITELPIGFTREKYFTFLTDLMKSKKILDFDEQCKEYADFTIYVNDEQYAAIQKKGALEFFRLVSYETQNLTCIDQHGKLKVFDDINQIIASFYDYRIQKTREYLDYSIVEAKERLKFLEVKLAYVEEVLKGVLDFKQYTKANLAAYLGDKFQADKEDIEQIISIPSYSFTQENVLKLKSDIETVKSKIQSLETTVPKDLLLDRLKALKFT